MCAGNVYFNFPSAAWTPLEKQLQTSNISLVALSKNLIDAIWDQQPAPPSEPLLTLDMKYTGEFMLILIFLMQ